MRTSLRLATLIPLFVIPAAHAIAQQRSITYRWLNEPCAEVISCEGGCTACNVPEAGDAAFFGTNAAWLGVNACPMPFAVGDNAVFTEGWGAQPDEGKGLLISLIALAPTSLDSIVIKHRSWSDGPERIRVSLRVGNGEWSVLHDGPAMGAWERLTITGEGCLAAQEDIAYGFAQLRVQAYGGGEGAWVLDELRIAGSECQPDLTMGIAAVASMPATEAAGWFDALGRSVGAATGSAAYLSRGKRMVVVR